MNACRDCLYWQKDVEELGQCRRYPPTTLGANSRFPYAVAGSWCGEWKTAVEYKQSFSYTAVAPLAKVDLPVKRKPGRPRKDGK